MNQALSKKLVLSALAGLAAGVASCGGGTPEPATPASEEHAGDKNSCSGGPGHSCGAKASPSSQDEQKKEGAGTGNAPKQ